MESNWEKQEIKTEVNTELEGNVTKSSSRSIDCSSRKLNVPQDNKPFSKVSDEITNNQGIKEESVVVKDEPISKVKEEINDEWDEPDLVEQSFFCQFCECYLASKDAKNLHEIGCSKKNIDIAMKCCTPEIETIGNHFLIEEPVVDDKIFACQMCSYRTNRSDSLRGHIMNIHDRQNAKMLCCDICDFKTVHRKSMYRHKKCKHTPKEELIRSSYKEIERVECEYCHKTFNKRYMNVHFMRHFKDDAVEIVDKEIQSKAKLQKCNFCDYTSYDKSNLTRHTRKHLGLKLYFCPSCCKEFNEKKLLDAHILFYHRNEDELVKTITNKIHDCTKCEFKTVYFKDYKKHLSSKHKVDMI